MNKTILLFLLLLYYKTTISQTTLFPGDVLVIGLKTNTTTDAGNDAVKLVTLVDLSCNTEFIVTDNNWNGSAWACNDDECGVKITCTTYIPAGSVFYVEMNSSGDPVTCTGGTVTRTDLGSPWGTNYGFNSQGDNVYVLQGTRAAPVFISAWKHNGAFSSATCSTKDNAALPSELTVGTSAVVMSSTNNQWHYNCSILFNGTASSLKSAICNSSNWISTGGQNWNENTCLFTLTPPGSIWSGSMSVSGAGCGCQANCNLAFFGGVNCGSGVTGNCSAGQIAMSKTIIVPSGCTYIVSATIRLRNNGCNSGSGADSGDQLKVDASGGSKSFVLGSGDGTIADSYTMTGPGTIVISASANRADEILTYYIKTSPCNCAIIVLPVELIEFNAEKKDGTVLLSWSTLSETNNHYFLIERTMEPLNEDGWETLSVIEGSGTSSVQHDYQIYDSSPLEGLSFKTSGF
jgi:hypothetical protein